MILLKNMKRFQFKYYTFYQNSFILVTSKNPPKFLSTKIKDLLSRLSSSIVVEVFQPDNELLSKIIKNI